MASWFKSIKNPTLNIKGCSYLRSWSCTRRRMEWPWWRRWRCTPRRSCARSCRPPGGWINFICCFLWKSQFSKNGPTLASFSFIFVFSNTHYKFYNNRYVKKCPSSIRCRDLKSRPLEYESPPITTRPGLQPKFYNFGPKLVDRSIQSPTKKIDCLLRGEKSN